MKYKIASFNVTGLCNNDKRDKLFHKFHLEKYDIILLQETFLNLDKIEKLDIVKEWYDVSKGEAFFGPTDIEKSQGVAILLGNNLANAITQNFKTLIEGRAISLDVLIETKYFKIVNTYAPCEPRDRPDFFTELGNKLLSEKAIPTLMGGDFNCVQDAKLDKTKS